jgi:CO/xanthine dehydrogenase FAD-binding subunit
MAYDAVVVLESRAGVDEVPLDRFYTDYKQMRRRPDQLVTAIRVPRAARDVQVFEKVGTRRAQAIAKVGLAVTRGAAGWRVVASSVAPTVRRCPAVERLLAEMTPIGGPGDLLPALDRDVTPIDDVRSTAEYRRLTLARVLHYALRDHWGGA